MMKDEPLNVSAPGIITFFNITKTRFDILIGFSAEDAGETSGLYGR